MKLSLTKILKEAEQNGPDIFNVTEDEAREIGDRLGVDWDRFDFDQFKKGLEVEYEHTSDPGEAGRITLDHLKELPNYYDRLEKMESGK